MLDDHNTPLQTPSDLAVCCYCWSRVPYRETRLDMHSRRWCVPCYKTHVEPNLEKDPKIAKSPF